MNDDWFRKYQEQMDKWLEPQRQFQEQMDRWLEPQRRFQEQMDKWLEPQRQFQEQMDRWLKPQRQLQEQMDKLFEPQRRLQEQMSKWLEPKWMLQENIEKWERSFKAEEFISDILSKAEQENISVSQDGTISVGGAAFTTTEFSEVYSDLLDSIKNIPSPAQLLIFIYNYAQKLKKPIATFLLIILIPYLINITSNLTTSYFENIIIELANKPKREKIKAIKEEALKDFSPDFLQSYRFVTASTLSVRGGPSNKNPILDEISFGQVVKLVKKGRKWSAIEYIDEDTGEVVTGWVFNRYLARFKK